MSKGRFHSMLHGIRGVGRLIAIDAIDDSPVPSKKISEGRYPYCKSKKCTYANYAFEPTTYKPQATGLRCPDCGGELRFTKSYRKYWDVDYIKKRHR